MENRTGWKPDLVVGGASLLLEEHSAVRIRMEALACAANWLAPVKAKQRNLSRSLVLHLGAFGLFWLAIVDSSPIPTFGGADILTAILAASHRDPWWEYAAATTAGSVVGAFLTYRVARKAGLEFLHKRFGQSRVSAITKYFERWGTVALAVSAGVPFPFPTTVFFAAAGAADYNRGRFLAVVGLCRAARYSLVAFFAARYGHHFVRALRHPSQYAGWLLLASALVAAGVAVLMAMNRRLESLSKPNEGEVGRPASTEGTALEKPRRA